MELFECNAVFVILNLESLNTILFNMNMKKMLFLAAAIALVATSVSAATFVTEPRSINLTIYEKGKSAASFKVVSITGFEKQLSIGNLPEWVTCQPKDILINRSTTPVVELTADASDLKPGNHQASIIIKTSSNKDNPEEVTLPVNLTVLPESEKPTATPRSIDIKPNLSRIIVINNPSKTSMTFDIKSSGFWIQTYPETVDVPAQSSNMIWVKMTATHFAGGVYPSTVTISNDISSFEIPVKAMVSSGIEFSPDSMSESGSITMTNKLKNTVLIRPAKINGVEFSVDNVSLAPGKSKAINVKFTGEPKPEYISFGIVNGTNSGHIIRVIK